MATRRTVDAWVKASPLSKWRTDTGSTKQRVAVILGKSCNAITSYENGNYRPTSVILGRIAKLIGVTQTKLETDWAAWLSKRPGTNR